MYKDKKDTIIYVGKASILKRRVRSYFTKQHSDTKTNVLVSHIQSIDWIVTSSEVEALFLEAEMIRRYMPRYNILLRDDKSYPYIFLSEGEAYPRLAFHRGAKQKKGRYFGPFPHSGAVRQARGACNRLPNPEEAQVLAAWLRVVVTPALRA